MPSADWFEPEFRTALPLMTHTPDQESCDRIRVAVVDDSATVRALLSRWLAEMPEVEIVGVHRNGLEALRQVASVRPDLIVLDIEMPEMDGLTALPLLLEASPDSRVLVVSGVSLRGADMTLRCLLRGASDYLPKPSAIAGDITSADFRDALQMRVRALGARKPGAGSAAGLQSGALVKTRETVAESTAPPASAADKGIARATTMRSGAQVLPQIAVIGASTGGPAAIAQLLKAVTPVLTGLPVVVAQHMPATLTMLFADHLRRHAGLKALEIAGGEPLRPGAIHVVRGERNLAIVRHGTGFSTVPAPGPGGRSTPSVDILLTSAAQTAGAATLALVLTGMGDDGVNGAAAVAAVGGTVLVQDEASSVVWGMPGAVAKSGFATARADIPGLARLVRAMFPPE